MCRLLVNLKTGFQARNIFGVTIIFSIYFCIKETFFLTFSPQSYSLMHRPTIMICSLASRRCVVLSEYFIVITSLHR